VLPLWLGKEVFGYLYGDASIAYWAHTGGLIAGFITALVLISRRPPEEVLPQAEEESTPESRALARTEKLQNEGKLLEASQAACAAIRQHPQSLPLIQRAIELTAAAPESENHHRANLALFALAGDSHADARTIATGYHRYLQSTQKPLALNAKACLLLARRAAQDKDWKWLEELLRRLHKQGVEHPLLQRLGMALVNHYRRLGEEQRAKEVMQLLQKTDTVL
jgi:hypothetical protein